MVAVVLRDHIWRGQNLLINSAAKELRPRPKLALDAQHFVPLSHSLAAAERTDLELSSIGCDRQVRDECVFRFSRTRRDHGQSSGALRGLNRFERFRDRANLVQLDE